MLDTTSASNQAGAEPTKEHDMTTAFVEAMIQCKKCGASVSEFALFPGKICVDCHAKKFDKMVAANGGNLPKPDFSKVIA